jgi:hypothetical protein
MTHLKIVGTVIEGTVQGQGTDIETWFKRFISVWLANSFLTFNVTLSREKHDTVFFTSSASEMASK